LGAILFEMPMTRKRIAVIASISVVLLAVAGIEIIRSAKGYTAPLGQARPIRFRPDGFAPAAREEFLNRDFTIVKDVRVLPVPVREALSEQGGSRFVMANPDEKFESSDFIVDSSLPRRRLIFAGVSSDRCFIHYERGGRGRSYLIAFFKVTSAKSMEPLWSGYCDGPSPSFQDLRSKLATGKCLAAPSNPF
jgi:hypothetical protein